MADNMIAVRPEIAAGAHVNAARYRADVRPRRRRSGRILGRAEANRIDWIKPPTKMLAGDFTGDVHVTLVRGRHAERLGQLPRPASGHARRPGRDHLGRRRSQTSARHVTYRELHEQVCRLANVLKSLGVAEGRPGAHLPADGRRGGGGDAGLRADRRSPHHRVRRLLPRQPRQPHPGCRREGADHRRRGPPRRPDRRVEDKRRCGAEALPRLRHVIVVAVTGKAVPMQDGRDHDYTAAMAKASPDCPPAEMNAEDPLFILYTSGSTGKPKGALHTTGGYSSGPASRTNWCSTTGPARSTGAPPMSAGSPATPTSSMARSRTAPPRSCSRASRPTLTARASGSVVDKHQVNIFYTAPTAIRSLMREGEAPVRGHQPEKPAHPRQRRRADQSRGMALVLPRGRRAALSRSWTRGGRPRPVAS